MKKSIEVQVSVTSPDPLASVNRDRDLVIRIAAYRDGYPVVASVKRDPLTPNSAYAGRAVLESVTRQEWETFKREVDLAFSEHAALAEAAGAHVQKLGDLC